MPEFVGLWCHLGALTVEPGLVGVGEARVVLFRVQPGELCSDGMGELERHTEIGALDETFVMDVTEIGQLRIDVRLRQGAEISRVRRPGIGARERGVGDRPLVAILVLELLDMRSCLVVRNTPVEGERVVYLESDDQGRVGRPAGGSIRYATARIT